MEEIKINGKKFGKSFEQFQKFIYAIKTKEKPLMMGVDYVCMSRDMYNDLANRAETKVMPKITAIINDILQVGEDWADAGDYTKTYAAYYLAGYIKDKYK